MTVKELEAQALTLSVEERAWLARSLLSSLDSVSEEEVEALWLEEAKRRNDEAENDPSVEIPVDQSLREARKLLG